MKRLSFYIITIILVSLFLPVYALAANGNSTKNEFNPINTGVTSANHLQCPWGHPVLEVRQKHCIAVPNVACGKKPFLLT